MTNQEVSLVRRRREPMKVGDIFSVEFKEKIHILGQVITTDITSYDRGIDCLVVFYKLKAAEVSHFKEITSLEGESLLLKDGVLVGNRLWGRDSIQMLGNLPVPKNSGQFLFDSLTRRGVVDCFGKIVENYSGESKLPYYRFTTIDGILEKLNNAYEKEPEWFNY